MATAIGAQIEIEAPIERVWQIVSDLAAYPEWNPFTPRVESSLRLGDPVTLHVRMKPNRELVRVERITAVEPKERLCWSMQLLAPFVLASERCQTVTALAEGRTRYSTENRFRGFLVPLVLWIYGEDMRRGFNELAAALKKRAER
jgi:hypothetical protein